MSAAHRDLAVKQTTRGTAEGTTGATQWTTAQLTLTIEFVQTGAQAAQAAPVEEAEPAAATHEGVEATPAPPARGRRKRPAPRRRKAVSQSRAKRTSKKAPPRRK